VTVLLVNLQGADPFRQSVVASTCLIDDHHLQLRIRSRDFFQDFFCHHASYPPNLVAGVQKEELQLLALVPCPLMCSVLEE